MRFLRTLSNKILIGPINPVPNNPHEVSVDVTKAMDTTQSIAWRREAWKEEAPDDLPSTDERGPSPIRQKLEQLQRQR